MRSWLTALRIARREARRAKGRSALVLAMIALPVALLSFAAVSLDMFTLTTSEELDRGLGAADGRLSWVADGPIEQTASGFGWSSSQRVESPTEVTEAKLLAVLPPGSKVLPQISFGLSVRTPNGLGTASGHLADVTDPMLRGQILLMEGKAPAAADEVALNEGAAKWLKAGIGDTVKVVDPDRTFKVTGIVDLPESLRPVLTFAPAAREAVAPNGSAQAGDWLVDTPQELDWALVKKLNQAGLLVRSRSVLLNPPPGVELGSYEEIQVDELALGAVVAGLGVLEIVLLAGPAFAVGARRRSRDLALIAAAGAEPKQLRRVVLADGVVLGVAGAVVGVLLGVLLATIGRPFLEDVAGRRAGGWRFFPLALLGIAALAVGTGLLAALVPAFTAARQNVVQVLSGRRGIVKSRKRWITLGLVMIAAGAVITALGGWQTTEELILAGMVLVELGLVVVTPGLIGLIARGGRMLPLAPRLALRSTARNRSSAAPAISAMMAAVAGAIAVGAFASSSNQQQANDYEPSLPHGYVGLQYFVEPGKAPIDWNRAQAAVQTVLPTSKSHLYSTPACVDETSSYCDLSAVLPESRRCPFWSVEGRLTPAQIAAARVDERCNYRGAFGTGGGPFTATIVDDGTLLAVFTGADPADLEAAQRVLANGGVVTDGPQYVVDGMVDVAVPTKDTARTPSVKLPGYGLTSGVRGATLFVSPGALKTLGLTSKAGGLVAQTDAMPTSAQQEQLNLLLNQMAPNFGARVERGALGSNDPIELVLALAAAAIALGAAGIATGLAATDARSDLATLAAVGADPGVRKRLSLSQAGLISGLGAVLGTLIGLGGAVALITATNKIAEQQWPSTMMPFTVPWASMGVLICVPVIAMAGAALFTRSRLHIERRI